MKRRVNNLASSTAKKRAWREEPAEEEAGDLGGPLPDSDDEKPPPPKDPPPGTQIRTGSPNPVVWMEVAVADKSRGRLHFELFQDLAPQASESFRKLCVGHTEDSGATVTYAQTAIDLVYAGRYITAGDIDASLSFEGIDRSGELTHQKAGLLTMPCGSASLFDPRFQITLGSVPEFDGKQLVFGQLLASPGSALHPLHWIEAMGTANGTPREEISIKACGECSAEECQVLLGAMVMAAQVDRTPEHQVDRYGRTGHMHGELEDAVTHDNLTQVLELTEDLLGHLEWACKRTMGTSERDRKAGLFEVQLKSLVKALKKVEFKAGDVKGYENRLALDAKSQLGRAKDLEESLVRVY